MSSMRVIWLKISTREPPALSLSSSLSRSVILPAFSMSRWSLMKGGSSAPSKRYGWLAHLRSCISTLSMRVLFPPLIDCTTSMFLERMLEYHLVCMSLMPISSLISRLGGRLFSTSDLRRRSRKGRRILCSCSRMSPGAESPSMLNHWSKVSDSEKMSGSKKLSIAQSSCRLFWSGVPEMSMRKCVENMRTTFESTPCSFLMRCASSMTRYLHVSFVSAAFSAITTSYVVMHTSKPTPDSRYCSLSAVRVALSP
mmetsp:Transcript_15263/g.41105  ORF Transcript_15263/g.41105 Transcript_15263/m.41105 type:complete len:254 (-) Transcript_15263:161-922(-)